MPRRQGATDDVPPRSRLRGALRGATPLALAGMLANVANLGVTLVIARAMSTRSYGATAVLFALFMVVSMPGSALLVGVVRRVTTWTRTGRADLVVGWAARVRSAGLRTVVVVALLALAVRGPLAHELSLPGPGGVAQTLTAGAAWCLLCVDRGLLQATRRYRELASNLLVDAAVKGAATVGLVLAGLGQAGAATAVLCGVLAALLHARLALRRLAPGASCPPAALTADPASTAVPASAAGPGPGAARERRLAVELGAALGALGFLALLQNIDVLIQGRLAPAESGQYAAVSVTSKVLMFGAVVLAGFLLPEAADRRHLGEHALHQLGATLAILLAPAAVLLAVATAAPATLLSLAFGPRFTDASGALLPLAGAMTCLGATVLFTHYLLALASRAVLVALGITATAAAGLITLAGGSPVATARMDLAVQAVLAVVTGLLVVGAARRTTATAAASAPVTEVAA
jgi:O-antigen/teichoic acid export membrane protein